MDWKELNSRILPPDAAAMQAAGLCLDAVAKPLNGLGELEEICKKIAGLVGSAALSLQKRAVVVFCADNGVTAEGIAQTDASVTVTMAEQIARGRSCVCRMAQTAGADVLPVDVGMFRRAEQVRDLHVADGTGNIAEGPAMTRKQALQAIETGIRLAEELKTAGYELLACGEMGIGNTTTCAAMASVLLQLPVEQTTGPGAGLTKAGLEKKREVVARAIRINHSGPEDALGVLAGLGGFDIAAMTGLYLGGALYRIPVIIDGVISSVAALTAAALCPDSVCAMIPSHCSAEPAARAVMEKLGLRPLLWGGFKLGEGTGAVCMMPLLDMALAVYDNALRFSDSGISQYERESD